MFYICFSVILLLCLLILYVIKDKEVLLKNIIKVLTILFMVFMFINILLPDSFVYSLSEEELGGNNYFEAIIRWFRFVSFLVIPIAIFYNKKYFVRLSIYFVLPIALINLVIFFMYLPDITTTSLRGIANIRFFGEGFRSFISNVSFRSGFFALISLLELIILSYILYKNYRRLKFRSIKEIGLFILGLFSLILVCIPIYIPQYLFGYTNIIFDSYTLIHLIWIVVLILEFIVLTIVFKNQSSVNKYILVLIMSLALLLQYNMMFASINELTFERMPLQLCNIGSYLILITLLTKSKKLFSFTLIVNVVGALIALSVMDVDGKGLGYLWNMHFILEHSSVIIIPLLCLSLEIFPKVKHKDLLYVLVGFTIYFVVVLSLGTEVNSIYAKDGNDFFKANYLFMFDQEKAAKLVPSLGKLFDFKLNIGDYTYYPVIQTAVYFIFSSLCVGVFYLIYGISNIKKEEIAEVNSTELVEDLHQ